MEQTMIKVTINGETREYPKMTPYSEIIRDYEGKTEYPVILVTENGKLRELHKKLQHDCTLGFITAKDSAGRKTYRRSAIFILLKAIFDVAGKENVDHVVIHYSIGNALYFTMKGSATLDQELLDRVKVRMREIRKFRSTNAVSARMMPFPCSTGIICMIKKSCSVIGGFPE